MASPFNLKMRLKDENSIFEWLCIAIVYTIYFWPAGNSGLIILLTIYWLFFKKKSFDLSSVRTRLMILFCSLFLVALIGLSYTENMQDGIFRLQQKSAIFFFPLIFGTIKISEQSIKKIKFHFILATCLACTISIIYGLIQFFSTGNPDMLAKHNLMIFRDLNPPMSGLLCLVAIIILISEFYWQTTKKILLISAVSLLSLYIFLLSVRLVIACLLGVLLIFAMRSITSVMHRILLAAMLILVSVLATVFIPTFNKQWKELVDFSASNTIVLDKDESLGRGWGGKSIRIAIWKCSKDVLSDHWLTGVGTGDVQDSLQAAYEKRKFYFAAYHNTYNAHNQYLEFWLANGLPGLLIYILCLIVPLLLYQKYQGSLGYSLFLAIVIIISFTETFLNVNKGIIWYSFFNSIFAFTYGNQNKMSKTLDKKAL